MKKYIIAVMLLLLPTVVHAKCCDCCVEKYIMYTPINATTTTFGTMTMRGYAYGSKSLNDTGIKKLIGKVVYRTRPLGNDKYADRSYMGEPKKLLAVTTEHLIFESTVFIDTHFEIERDIWDDGNWEEFKPKRLTVTEVKSERFYFLLGNTSKYSCVRCSKRLDCSTGDFNYYCTSCKTGFTIKEE